MSLIHSKHFVDVYNLYIKIYLLLPFETKILQVEELNYFV